MFTPDDLTMLQDVMNACSGVTQTLENLFARNADGQPTIPEFQREQIATARRAMKAMVEYLKPTPEEVKAEIKKLETIMRHVADEETEQEIAAQLCVLSTRLTLEGIDLLYTDMVQGAALNAHAWLNATFEDGCFEVAPSIAWVSRTI